MKLSTDITNILQQFKTRWVQYTRNCTKKKIQTKNVTFSAKIYCNMLFYNYKGLAFLETFEHSWIYCDFNETGMNKSVFKGWWTPFTSNVLIVVLI